MTSKTANRADRTLLAILGLILAVALFFALNIFANGAFRGASLDLTQGGLFTLSQGTKTVLAHLKEPVTLRFYFSKKLGDEVPSYGAYAARVRELLERYNSLADGKIRLEFYDPEPFSDAEDRAVGFGLQGVPLGDSGDQVYFGLVGTNSTDDQQVIPFFQPDRERFLEYDVTKLVASLANPKKKVIGLITSLPLGGSYGNPMMGAQNAAPWVVMDEMRQQFDVRELGPHPDKIDKDIDVLMIVHPKDLPLQTQFAIDQYVLGGGRALVFVDPNAESDMGPSPMMMTGATSSNLKRLFDAWGLELVPDKVAGDRNLATQVSAPVGGRTQTIDYIAWLSLDQNDVNHNDVVTTDISSLLMATPGILEKRKEAPTTFTPLVQTTAQATEIPADKLRLFPDFLALEANYKPVGHPLTLAARIRGNVKTAFPDGPPATKKPEAAKAEAAKAEPGKSAQEQAKAGNAAEKPAEGKAEPAKPAVTWLKQSVKPINVIVVADADMLADRYWVRSQDFFGQKIVQPTAGNGDFVIDALDNLAGSDALIGLRGRGLSQRPFVLVQRLRAEADARYLAKAQELQDRLKEAQKKLASLQKEGGEGASHQILTADQQKEIDKFRGEMVSIRKSLRDVQRALRENIERLGATLKFVDIALMPILIGIVAIVVALVRARRRRHRHGLA
ncbi:MAG TPA: Gldg family protein [Alphaproteobacteria bacterium]|nr:Gldg family protein [Alphaproteobacteria bacterium]